MRKLFVLALGLAFLSCQTGQEQSKATIKNVDDGTTVYISKYINGNREVPVDTMQVKNGEVHFKLPEDDFQTLYNLKIEGVNGKTLFINENRPVTGTVYKDSIESSRFKGGEANEQFSAYLESLKKDSQKLIDLRKQYSSQELGDPDVQKEYKARQADIRDEVTAERKRIIKNHPDVLSTIFVFGDLINSRAVSDAEMRELFDGLSNKLKNTPIGKSIQKELNKSATVAIGKKAPNFSAKTPEGKEYSLDQVLKAQGKYTLVEFWASWCPDCQREMPNVVKVYNQFHDQGLKILSVSIDTNKKEWEAGINDFGMDWHHISNLKKWKGPIVRQYHVTSIPSNFLLDENGKIIAKDLQGDDLKDKMNEIFSES